LPMERSPEPAIRRILDTVNSVVLGRTSGSPVAGLPAGAGAPPAGGPARRRQDHPGLWPWPARWASTSAHPVNLRPAPHRHHRGLGAQSTMAPSPSGRGRLPPAGPGDEINRATPKTQSALLEAMAEGQVSVRGSPGRCRNPSSSWRRRTPVEHYGTFPPPESQVDRFMMSSAWPVPGREANGDSWRASTSAAASTASPRWTTRGES